MSAKRQNRDFRLSLEKVEAGAIRKNLLLASLYITIFEALRNAIVEDVHSFFVIDPSMLAEEASSHHAWQSECYEREIGIKPDLRESRGLIGSCRWLQKMEVIGDQEVTDVGQARKHRNDIAHKLPYVLIQEGFDVDLRLMSRMVEILEKVDAFWIRMDLETGAYDVNGREVKDWDKLEVYSSRVLLLKHFVKSVFNIAARRLS
ncbi:hypothetical protein ACFL2Q_11690 [Thermodesulfobacteriota bacterium]